MQWFSNLSASEPPGGLVDTDGWAPPEFLIAQFWSGAQELLSTGWCWCCHGSEHTQATAEVHALVPPRCPFKAEALGVWDSPRNCPCRKGAASPKVIPLFGGPPGMTNGEGHTEKCTSAVTSGHGTWTSSHKVYSRVRCKWKGAELGCENILSCSRAVFCHFQIFPWQSPK